MPAAPPARKWRPGAALRGTGTGTGTGNSLRAGFLLSPTSERLFSKSEHKTGAVYEGFRAGSGAVRELLPSSEGEARALLSSRDKNKMQKNKMRFRDFSVR